MRTRKNGTTPKWGTVNAIAEQTGASRRHIARWLDLEAVPSRRRGERILFDREAAQKAIALHRRPDTEATPGAQEQNTAELRAVVAYEDALVEIQALAADPAFGLTQAQRERVEQIVDDAGEKANAA